jgi:TolA-binding protein
MDAVTYPHAKVTEFVNKYMVPVRLESGKNPELGKQMNVRWLPGVVVASADGRPAMTSIGFLPPDDLVSDLTFGRAIVAMGEKRYDDAHALFRSVGESDAERAPEAMFWWGVSRYRQSKRFEDAVGEPWGKILERWPRSQWARKVAFAVGKPELSYKP